MSDDFEKIKKEAPTVIVSASAAFLLNKFS